MAAIDDELSAYEAMRASLEADHSGKWIVMRDRAVIGIYSSFENAAAEAVRRFGRGPYLIREIGAPPLKLPASVLYHRDARY